MAQQAVNPFLFGTRGSLIHPLNPVLEEIDMHDIVVSISNTCRYGGRVSSFYSVAQHSTVMSFWAEELHESISTDIVKAALLHDAAEGWIGDIPTPIKKLWPQIDEVEKQIAKLVFEMHDVDPDLFDCEEIAELDNIMFNTECRDVLVASSPPTPHLCIPPEMVTINPQMPPSAFSNFKMRYNQVFGDRALPITDYHSPV